jgi:branched-subunit amino acid aminotransferase/4-amino-4-deoxychorismate lyase
VQGLLRENEATEAVLRITLTRGSGARGYSPRGAGPPTLALTVHPRTPPPATVTLRTASLRIAAGDGLARFKTANKLASVLARAEADDNAADEGLLLNTEGHVAEAAASNVFWVAGGRVHTPPLAAGALGGVLRAVLLELCLREGRPAAEQLAGPDELRASEGMFLTNSTQGAMPVSRWDGLVVAQSHLVGELRQKLEEESRRSAVGG